MYNDEVQNKYNGIHLYTSIDTSMMNVSAAYNEYNGMYLYNFTDTSMTNMSIVHNEYSGIQFDFSTSTNNYDECSCTSMVE